MAGSPTSTSPLSTFQFTAIGKAPTLLNRLSAPDPAAQGVSHSPSPSPTSSPKAPASNIARSTSRKSLLETLGGIEAQDTEEMRTDENTVRIEHDVSRPSPSSSSGTSSRQAPNSKASLASNGHPRPSPKMNGTHSPSLQLPAGDASHAPSANTGPAKVRPALSSLLPVPSLSFPALSNMSPGLSDQPSLPQDDALDGFRHALQRLGAESAEYLRRAEETRLAMARQQDQAARWHARADALIEPLSALLAQCERKITSANHVVAEVGRLQEVVRQHEEDAAEKARTLANLEARKADLARTLEEQKSRAADRQRLADACTAELRQAAERAVAEKTDLEVKLREAIARANAAERQEFTSSAERERRLVAQLAEQQRVAAQEKQVLLQQLEEQKRVAELEKQKRMAGLVAEKHRLDSQLRAEQEEQSRVQQRMQDQQTQNNDGGSSIDESRTSPTSRSSGRAPLSQPTVAPAVIEKPAAQAPTIAPSMIPPPLSRNGPVTPSQPPTAAPATRKRKPPSPLQKVEAVTSPHADRHIPPHMSPIVKPELATPSLKTNNSQPAHASPRTPTPAQTPTAKRVKPEPTTIGRKPAPEPSSNSLPGGSSVKPEVSTPLIDRLAQSFRPDEPSNSHSLRREQSLDYVARPSSSNDVVPSAQPPGGAPSSTGRPTTLSSSAAGPASLQQPPPLRPPTAAQLTVKLNAVNNSPPVVPAGVASAQSSSSQPDLPDLAYPSRDQSPALMVTSLPSDDTAMGLGILHPDDRGIGPSAGQRSRGTTPPRGQGAPARGRGRGRGRNAPVPARQITQTPVQSGWPVDHWSPTPDRPSLNRTRYSPPLRNKRAREDDESPERSRRARLSDSPLRNAAPPPRRTSGQYERSRSPYSRSKSRTRSPSPRPSSFSPPPRDRSYSPRRSAYSPSSPRRYPRSPSPPPPSGSTYDPTRGRGPSATGYAPPPPPPVAHPESEARLPQMVPTTPAVVANGGLSKIRDLSTATPRTKQRVATPTAAAAARAARGAPQGRAAPGPASEGMGKISLLERLQAGQAADGEKEKSTSMRGKRVASRGRGGATPRGVSTPRGSSTPRVLSLRGQRGGHPVRGAGPARGGASRSLADRISSSNADGV